MVPFGQLDDRAYPPSRLFGALRQYKQVYVLSYEVTHPQRARTHTHAHAPPHTTVTEAQCAIAQAPVTRDDFRRAGAEAAANVIILDQWSGKDADKKKCGRPPIFIYFIYIYQLLYLY